MQKCPKPATALKASLLSIAVSATGFGPSNACDIAEGASLPAPVEAANSYLLSGSYPEFLTKIDPFRQIPQEKRDAIKSGLEEFSSKGFENCIVLETTGDSGLFSKTFSFFYSGDKAFFVFYGAAKMDGNWKIIKSLFSSDFDEVFPYMH